MDCATACFVGGKRPNTEVRQIPRMLLTIGQRAFLLIDEGEEFIAGDAVRLGRPIAPAVGRFDGGLELFRGELRLALTLKFQVIEELQEHDPSKHRQTVEVAIEPLVLAHDVARGFQERSGGLSGGGLRGFNHKLKVTCAGSSWNDCFGH